MAETITTYIQRDLRARLLMRSKLPADWTLGGLSKHYRVSLTPIRLAVRALLAEGLLIRRANGRLMVNRAHRPAGVRVALPNPPPDLSSLEPAFTAEVIRLSLGGDSAYLREEVTAKRLGISRAILRQLLNRLQGKGLIEHLPRRGWRVRPFDEGDLRAYLEIRISLELKALDLAKSHLVREDLEGMLRGNLPSAAGQASRLDNHLHRYLILKSGNPYIRDFFERHGLYFTTLFDYAAPEARVIDAMALQHRRILRALIAQDWPRAQQALDHHIRSQQPVLRRLFQRLGSPPCCGRPTDLVATYRPEQVTSHR